MIKIIFLLFWSRILLVYYSSKKWSISPSYVRWFLIELSLIDPSLWNYHIDKVWCYLVRPLSQPSHIEAEPLEIKVITAGLFCFTTQYQTSFDPNLILYRDMITSCLAGELPCQLSPRLAGNVLIWLLHFILERRLGTISLKAGADYVQHKMQNYRISQWKSVRDD